MSKLIKPLSQNDLANGWHLIVPSVKHVLNKKYDSEDKIINNIYRSKVNLLQLPRHLHRKQIKLFNGAFKVINKSHHFFVEPTPVDKEINELVSILDKSYDIKYKKRIDILLKIFQENDLHGWPVIVALERYCNNNYESSQGKQ